MTRNERVIAGLCLGAVACLGAAPPAHAGGPGGAQFFLDPIQFEQTMADIGKVSKAQWDFKPDFAAPGSILGIPGVLDINSHPVIAPGVWTDAAGNDVWPPEVDNVQFLSNLTPGTGPLTLGSGIFYAKAPFQGLDNNMLGADFFVESFDIISGPPAGDNHTAISFELLQLAFGFPPPVFLVSVFNKNEELIGIFQIDGLENQKIFLGILAPPGDTIQRIDIWDQSGGPEGISSLALYQQQLPACPGDCGFPPDKVVNIVDFLALIAQWGGPGSCDLNGDGVVSNQDFLLLLALWGPCPTPTNDECVDKEIIDRLDPAAETVVHFDMYGSTPSPEGIQCIGIDPNPFKDSWYCLRNVTDTKKLVTVLGTVDLLVEVTAGCVCPPGPLVTCGRLIFGDAVFPLQPGEEVCLRLINDLQLPNDVLKGDLIIRNEPIQVQPVNFFTDPGLFEEAAFEAGKFAKAVWDFKPDHVPPGTPGLPIGDFLDILSHPVNAPGVWLDAAGTDLWPPEVDNVRFASNLIPQGPWKPRGTPDALAYWKAGSLPGLDNNALTANYFVDSFDIISGPPAGDNHTAIAFEVLQLPGFGFPDPVFIISVYDKNEQEIGSLTLTALPGQKLFVGILSKDPAVTIGRVDIWDTSGGSEGISFIALYQQQSEICANDCGVGNVDEGEACAGDEYVDVINGGCNSVPPVFGAAQCGDTVCGTGSTFSLAGAASRDTDWYLVDLPDPDGDGVEELRARLSSEFDGVCFIIDGVGPGGVPCNPVVVGTPGSAINCDPTGDAFACLPAPGTYAVFVATSGFSGSPCVDGDNDYTVTITCDPCPPGAMPSGAFDAETSAQMLAPVSP
ncbi:MAG: hypothetical protein ACYTGF_05275 [Planctomycetota bacterium]|jgi:hypothetical protein